MNKNLLDMIVSKNKQNDWQHDQNDLVTIFVPRQSLLDKLIRCFKNDLPTHFQIHLDEFGSFIWNSIDDSKSIMEIADCIRKKFGDDAEPVFNRLIHFLKLLRNNHLIFIRNNKT